MSLRSPCRHSGRISHRAPLCQGPLHTKLTAIRRLRSDFSVTHLFRRPRDSIGVPHESREIVFRGAFSTFFRQIETLRVDAILNVFTSALVTLVSESLCVLLFCRTDAAGGRAGASHSYWLGQPAEGWMGGMMGRNIIEEGDMSAIGRRKVRQPGGNLGLTPTGFVRGESPFKSGGKQSSTRREGKVRRCR